MGNNMDKKTIDKTADIIRRYLDVNKSSNYEYLLNQEASWRDNIRNSSEASEYKKVLKDISRIETNYKRLNIFFDQIVKQAREAAE